ncbi:phytanoyl-CoA dioxygenase [Metarhizium robertsii]|uniref:Phytanoyl-CoA dioxygenase n=1 Tax=Metarhizium robertsii TaxID=568076 RepID=A0A014N8K6_9HYPO|nr:phytanoyl-CoA dioxygenase [Metarhizium robertsii]
MARRVPLDRPEEAIRVVKEDGGVILTGFTSTGQVDKVNQDIEEIMTRRKSDEAFKAIYNGRIYCGHLYGLSKTAREEWALDPNIQSIVNHFLRTVNPPEVDKNSMRARSTNAILSQANSILTLPGGAGQALHRDDSIWQKVHPSQEESGYCLGSDLGIALLVPGVQTTRANGATLFVPGSHLWGDAREATDDQVRAVEMQPGEAFLFLGSALHGGGANSTQIPRLLHAIFFCRSWVRPEANEFAWWTEEEVQKWSVDAQRLAGYVTDKMLGICDDGDPIDALRRHRPA